MFYSEWCDSRSYLNWLAPRTLSNSSFTTDKDDSHDRHFMALGR